MAGYPPRRNGYFIERSTTRSLRRICGALVEHFRDVDPICFLLLPAAVFMLCPSSAHPPDAELLGELFRAVEQDPGSVEEETQAWLTRRAGALSPYFLNRFGARRGVLHVGDLPRAGWPLEPPGWRTLTFRQACMVVGALYAAVQSEAEVALCA